MRHVFGRLLEPCFKLKHIGSILGGMLQHRVEPNHDESPLIVSCLHFPLPLPSVPQLQIHRWTGKIRNWRELLVLNMYMRPSWLAFKPILSHHRDSYSGPATGILVSTVPGKPIEPAPFRSDPSYGPRAKLRSRSYLPGCFKWIFFARGPS